jgi:hypothetical protein
VPTQDQERLALLCSRNLLAFRIDGSFKLLGCEIRLEVNTPFQVIATVSLQGFEQQGLYFGLVLLLLAFCSWSRHSCAFDRSLTSEQSLVILFMERIV